MMHADSEPLAPSVSCCIARTAWYKLFMSYIEEDKTYGSKHLYISRYRLARGLHTHDTTTSITTTTLIDSQPSECPSCFEHHRRLGDSKGSRPCSPHALVDCTCFKPPLPLSWWFPQVTRPSFSFMAYMEDGDPASNLYC